MKQVKVDLHVHTPASADYKGKKDDSEYLDIIEKCIDNNLSTIAITDHNTIKGYEKFKILEFENNNTLMYLNKLGDGQNDTIKKLEEIKNKFEKITIIPGIELSVYPNIHFIILFNENIETNLINDFLISDLGINQSTTNADTKTVINKTPDQLANICKEKFNDEFLIILPHVDSSNGAWNELEGQSRINLYNNSLIFCYQILNLDTIEKINKISNNNGYDKNKKITFIQASDFHGSDGSSPGSQHSIFESETKINFHKLKKLIKNSKPKLSSSLIDEMYNNFKKEHSILSIKFDNKIEIKDESSRIEISEKFCAFLNSEGCAFEIIVNNTNDQYAETSDIIINLLKKEIFPHLDPDSISGFLVFDFSYSITKKKFDLVIRKRTKVFLYNDKILLYDNNIIRTAKSNEINSIVLKNSYNRFYKRKEKFLEKKSNDILLVSKAFIADSIFSKIYPYFSSSQIGNYSDIDTSHIPPEDLLKTEKYGNGIYNGDYYYIENGDVKGGRLENSYSRVTCPEFKFDKSFSYCNEDSVSKQKCLAICDDGRVFFIGSAKRLFSESPILEFTINDEYIENEDKFLKGFSVYLKSNFILWFCLMFYETFDLTSLIMKKRNAIPVFKNKDIYIELSSYCNNIILEENEFLKKIPKIRENSDAHKFIKNHNVKINNQMILVEKQIVKNLNLTKSDYVSIVKTLNDLGYYTYEAIDNINTIFQ